MWSVNIPPDVYTRCAQVGGFEMPWLTEVLELIRWATDHLRVSQPRVELRYEVFHRFDHGYPLPSVLVLSAKNDGESSVPLALNARKHGLRLATRLDCRFLTTKLARFQRPPKLLADELVARKSAVPEVLAARGGFAEICIPAHGLIAKLGKRSGTVRLVGRFTDRTGRVFESNSIVVPYYQLLGDPAVLTDR